MRGENVVLFLLPLFAEAVENKDSEDAGLLAGLPLSELLAQRKLWASRGPVGAPEASPLMGPASGARRGFPIRKTYEEDQEDYKGFLHKKKENHKIHDILNISITTLSYLAFGGYLLCMVVGVIREKKRRFGAALPQAYGSQANNQLAQVLQQYLAQRPVRVKFPAVTVSHGGRKRRRRSGKSNARGRDGFGGNHVADRT